MGGTKSGRRSEARGVSSYRPETLVSFVIHQAVLATNKHRFADFLTANRTSLPKTDAGGIHFLMDTATRPLTRHFEALINRQASGDDDTADTHWRLVAFFDSVMPPHHRGPARRSKANALASVDTDEVSVTTATYVDVDAELPAHYLTECYAAGPSRSKPEVNLRGTAMRSYLRGRPRLALEKPAFVPGRAPTRSLEGVTMQRVLDDTVRDLVIVACEPPSSGGLEATRLAAEAGTLAIDVVGEHFERRSPLAWRLIRVVSECLRREQGWRDESVSIRHDITVRSKCWKLLQYIDETNPPGVYRARSLFEEAVGLFPKDVPDFEAWALPVLTRRALTGKSGSGEAESSLPVRERVTAAWTYVWRLARQAVPGQPRWEPARLQPLSLSVTRQTRDSILEHAAALQQPGNDRGLHYAGLFLVAAAEGRHFWVPYDLNDRKLLKESTIRHDFWTSTYEVTHVMQAVEAEFEGIPAFERDNLASLCLQALLTIDGVSRRECLTAIQYARLGRAAARLFSRVIETTSSTEHRWLVEVATFCLGWVAEDSPDAIDHLIDVARQPGRDSSIRMTALMALGDISSQLRHLPAGTRAADAALAVASAALSAYPTESENPHNTDEKILLRSSVYALAMLRSQPDRSVELLADVTRRGPAFFGEPATPGLAQWGIDRFNLRALVDEPPATERARLLEALAHQGPEILAGRRIIDPLKSLELIESAPAPQPSSRQRRPRASRTPS